MLFLMVFNNDSSEFREKYDNKADVELMQNLPILQ